jgi:Nucleotidyl transferase AbiEii toxin, Type IV TA system
MDVAAGKLEALFSRAEVRDFIDVEALLRGGYSRERLIELARQRDAGFDTRVLADMFQAVHRFNDRQFAAYGIDPADVTRIRDEFSDWQRTLRICSRRSPDRACRHADCRELERTKLRRLGKRVGGNPSRVRISYPPPL